MKVLIAEDSKLSRNVLASILIKYDYTVIEAEDGEAAVEKYIESDPDIILMDLMMPNMNGYDATTKIKELAGEKFIPIIVITSIAETTSLTRSIDSGADDYLNKPYNAEAIHAKIIALSRIKELHDTLEENKQRLEKLNKQAESELVVAEHIYDFVLEQGDENLSYVRRYMRPVTNFNGDILMTAHTPSGGSHIMLGDFTGHGLSAAIGAIPASEIFYRMTAKGFSIGDIAVELNDRLRQVLPMNMFCAACLIEIDYDRTQMSAWNGSMPDIIVTDPSGNILNKIPSSHTALGIVPPDKFDRKVDISSLSGNEHIYMCTDGLLDARNDDAVKFGMYGYLDCFNCNDERQVGLNKITDDLFSYVGDGEISDDISIIEVDVNKEMDTWHLDNQNIIENRRIAAEWTASLIFDEGALKEVNPVPLLLNMINGINVIHGHKERLYTVISELFVNSLEHGLLDLESSLKSSAEGFLKYFTQRETRLAELKDASISIDVCQKKFEGNWVIIIDVKDTGKGFNVSDSVLSLDDNTGLAGRGIELIRKVCESVDYNDIGNEVRAVYSLGKINNQ